MSSYVSRNLTRLFSPSRLRSLGRAVNRRSQLPLPVLFPEQTELVELLESRTLLAGTVVVEYTASGNLTLTGDGLDNRVRVTGSLTNPLSIVGESTTIVFAPNSQPLPVAEIPGKLIVNLGDGNDFLRVSDVQVNKPSRINLGAGDDTLVVRYSQFDNRLSIVGDDGADFFATVATTYQGTFALKTGAGIDGIATLACVKFLGRTKINSGDDGDALLVGDQMFRKAVVRTGTGADVVGVTYSLHSPSEALNFNLGSGDDVMAIASGIAAAPLKQGRVNGGSGLDIVGVGVPTNYAPSYISVETVIDPDPNAIPLINSLRLAVDTLYASRGGSPADLNCV